MCNNSLWKFDEANGNLCIYTPNTPSPWENILYSKNHYLKLDQCGQGESGYFFNRNKYGFTRDYRYFYLRNNDTGDYKALLYTPVYNEIENYECVHAPGYTLIKGKVWDLNYSIRVHLPLSESGECWTIKFEKPKRKLNLSLFAVTGLNYNKIRTTNAGWDDLYNCFFHHNPSNVHGFKETLPAWQYFAADAKIAAWDASEYRFFGGMYRHNEPQAVLKGICSSKPAIAVPVCCGLQFDFTLQESSIKKIHIYGDVAHSKEDAAKRIKEAVNEGYFERSFQEVQEYWNNIVRKIFISTPDKNLDIFVNYWLKKQSLYLTDLDREEYLSITARNLLQDLIGTGLIDAEKAWRKFTTVLEHQKSSGHLERGWPRTGTGNLDTLNRLNFRDGAVWLILVGCILLKWADKPQQKLGELYKFSDSDEKVSVYEHLIRAAKMLAYDKGPHGLNLLGEGDWNDALTGPGKSGKGESTMLSATVVYALKQLLEVIETRKDFVSKEFVLDTIRRISKAIEEYCWSEDRYARGTTDKGELFGTKNDTEGSIWLNAQTWPVIAGITSKEREEIIFDAIHKYLEFPQGLAILYPAFRSQNEMVGDISIRNPGTRVNGSIYNHAQAFAVAAAIQAGKADTAYRYLTKILPTNPENNPQKNLQAPIYIPNFYVGPVDDVNTGIASMMYNTGTAPWILYIVVEKILGIQKNKDYFIINPCIPSHWDKFQLEYTIGDTEFIFEVSNPEHLSGGIAEIRMDGTILKNNIVPIQKDGSTHFISVKMGKSHSLL